MEIDFLIQKSTITSNHNSSPINDIFQTIVPINYKEYSAIISEGDTIAKETQKGQSSKQVSGQVSGQVGEQVASSIIEYRKKVIEFCREPRSSKEIKEYLHISSRTYANDNIIKPLIKEGVLDYTNKNNIKASNQKYITKN